VTDLLPLLQAFYREKLTMMLRHQAAARLVGQYDINNTYQYIINREEVQLSWLATAIADLGGTVTDEPEPTRKVSGKGAEAARAILQAIEEALGRMGKGTYGVCRDCGEPIAAARLNAIPWTRVCIACKEKQSS